MNATGGATPEAGLMGDHSSSIRRLENKPSFHLSSSPKFVAVRFFVQISLLVHYAF
jgi:hypothetical protein